MKKYVNLATYTLFLLAIMAFTSCQSEFEEVNTADTQGESFAANSSTALLIEKTARLDGSFDNIVDGSSCIALNFPYSVNVNGIDLVIDSREDLHLIEEIFDEFEEDEDILEIIFPITITTKDLDELVIEGPDALEELVRDCVEGGDDDDIECIDFVYPITFYTFDVSNTQTGQVTVESDEQLQRFLKERGGDDIISIQYPITLVKYDGTEIRVSSNEELAVALDTARDICDEDDDDDYNDDDFDEERLANLLTECPWIVLTVERDAANLSDRYEAYKMFFGVDGAVEVKDREGNTLVGEWNLRMSDHGVLLQLSFDTLVDFNLTWLVYDIGDGKIKLFAEGGNRIIMKIACGDPGGILPGTLAEILRECSWIIKKVKNQGEEIDRLLGYEFEFQAEGVVTLSNGVTVSEGTWEVTTNTEGQLVLAISMGDEPGVNFEWPLRELLDNRLKFEVEEIDYELILLRVCPGTVDNDVAEIRNVLMGGDWMVAAYTETYMEETVDATAEFAGFDFNFGAEHVLTVSTNMDPLKQGLWRVVRDSEGKIKCYLNLGDDDDLLSELNEDWEFVSMTESRIELKDISGDGKVSVLVFEK